MRLGYGTRMTQRGAIRLLGALLLTLLSVTRLARPQGAPTSAGVITAAQSQQPTQILHRDEAEKIMPATVFFRGQTATTEGRNSAGLRLAGGALVLVALVDASGYSSGVAERYQGYLLTEVALRVGDSMLAAGAYGFGFLSGDRMVVMDLGGHDVLSTSTTRNSAMRRPEPLQIVNEGGQLHLYLGRSYVAIAPQGTLEAKP